MDRSEPGRQEEVDGAEQAFEALREEVAALRRGVEQAYRRGQDAKAASVGAIPDYSLTLGQMQKALQATTARLEAIEGKPALAATPAQQAAELRRELHRIGEDARRGLASSQAQLDGTVRELRGMMASARSRRDQRQWLGAVGGVGVMGGALLWFLLTAMLPWSGGTWLAGLAYGGRWNAGQAMLQDASPAAWDRMVRLYKACPQDSVTEVCEAAIAVRNAAPGQEGVKVAPLGTVMIRSKAAR